MAKSYRTLQLLAKLEDEVQQEPLVRVVIGGLVLVQSLTATAAVHSTIKNQILRTVVGAFAIEVLLDILLLLTVMAGVHRTSTRCKMTFSGGNDKWKSRFLRSCSPVKIHFGAINYVDKTMPLNTVNFANNLTVHLLLLCDNYNRLHK